MWCWPEAKGVGVQAHGRICTRNGLSRASISGKQIRAMSCRERTQHWTAIYKTTPSVSQQWSGVYVQYSSPRTMELKGKLVFGWVMQRSWGQKILVNRDSFASWKISLRTFQYQWVIQETSSLKLYSLRYLCHIHSTNFTDSEIVPCDDLANERYWRFPG